MIVTSLGVALATPVAVLSVDDGMTEFVAALDRDESLTYSYRQSIYQVPVYEELTRAGTGLRIERVRSPDVPFSSLVLPFVLTLRTNGVTNSLNNWNSFPRASRRVHITSASRPRARTRDRL